METGTRREQILHVLESQQKPVPGSVLARLFSVSRQVIVQDIALLRAENKNILSTNKGYVLFHTNEKHERKKRVFYLRHSTEDIEKELNCIVDNGGHVLDVAVDHALYGKIAVEFRIQNRADVEEFIKKRMRSKDLPLKDLTLGLHTHTVEAESEEILNRIEKKLREKGFLK